MAILNTRRTGRTMFVVVAAVLTGYTQAASPTHSGTIIHDTVHNLIWSVNPDTDTVTAIDASIPVPAKVQEIAVGKNPRTLAQSPADTSIWVVNQGDATITVLSSLDFFEISKIKLPANSLPYGVAFAPDGSAAFVTLQGTGQLVKISPTGPSYSILGTLDVGPSPRGIAITSDSARVFVTRFISAADRGEIREVDASTFTLTRTIDMLQDSSTVDSSINGRGVPNYISSITISPDGTRAWVPSKKDNTLRGLNRDGLTPTFETSVRTIVWQIDLGNNAEDTAVRADLDNSDMADAVCFNSTGTLAFIAEQGSNRVAVMSTATRLITQVINTGLAPQGLVLNGNDTKLFVQNFMGRTVSVFDVSNLPTVSTVATVSAIATEKLPASVLLGKQIFYNAADTRMSKDGYISCASCHVDGGQDGRVWDFTNRGEGFRNSVMLQGRSGVGHGPVHWTANFDEIQDFENDIRNAFGGTGLMSDTDFNSGTHSDPLGDPKAGLSADLDALSDYVSSLTTVHKSPYRDYTTDPNDPAGQLTADGQAGRLLFNQLNCLLCHAGSAFTDSGTGGLHDVGTIKPTSGKRRNQTLTGFDTPTLKGVWETGPYLHDGSAATLLDVLTTQNTDGMHGDVSSLTPQQLDQLVAYLLQIDEDEPGNTFPVVSIVSPSNNSSFDLPPSITLAADASDDGAVVKVEFFEGGNKIGEDTDAPFSVKWLNPAAGSYSVRAVATDNLGAKQSSAPVAITVKAPATVTLSNLSALFDGTQKAATATTVPAGLTVDILYDNAANPPNAAGAYNVVATINAANYFGSATGTLTIFPVLQFFSTPTAAPNPVIAGQPVLFTALTTGVNGTGLTFDWSFGDGAVSTTSLGFALHTYGAMGTYSASLLVTQNDGQSLEAPLTITVNPPDTDGDGITDDLDDDDDNDGVSDVNEIADGTDPLSAGSAASVPMPVLKMLIGLNFKSAGRDTLSLSGTIPSVPAIQNTAGLTVNLNVGGAVFLFTLNGKGQGALAKNKLTLKLKPGKRGAAGNTEFLGGDIAYKATVRGDFAAQLADEGLVSQDLKAQNVSVGLKLVFNGRLYGATVSGAYAAKAGRSGKFKK